MRLIDVDSIEWHKTAHGAPCIYPEDIEKLPTVHAIPVNNIRDAIKRIEGLKGFYPNNFYLKIIKSCIKEDKK